MNYLAHFALSYPNKEFMIGNFLADLIRLDEREVYTLGIQEGIRMHHRIDGFTDRHEKVLDSKKFIGNGYRRFSGILLDVFYDHLLSKHWNLFYTTNRSQLISETYDLLEAHTNFSNPRAKRFAKLL